MTSFTLNLISLIESFHDIFKKTLNITHVNITSFTVPEILDISPSISFLSSFFLNLYLPCSLKIFIYIKSSGSLETTVHENK